MNQKYFGNLIKYIIAILLLLGIATLINIGVERSNSQIEVATSQTEDRLNVAIVNEDQAITTEDGKNYHLGNSYVKSLEKNTEHNWTVTTRAAAEKGLEDNQYQLMIVIPSDFSTKVLDIDNQKAEPANVIYQVNSQGNTQVEVKANQLGEQIVASLNQQLVDMYMVSILSNVYTAQQNVSAIYQTQTDNVTAYQQNLYQLAKDFPSNFPNLTNLSGSSLTATDTLKSSLQSTITYYNSQQTAQQAASDSLTDILAAVDANKMSFADLMNALMSMEPKSLSTDITTFLSTLKIAQTGLSTAVSKVSIDTNNPGQATIEQLTKEIDDLKALVAKGEADNQKRLSEFASTLAKNLYSYYVDSSVTDKELQELTVQSFVDKANLKISATAYDDTTTARQDAAIRNALGALMSQSDYATVASLLPSDLSVSSSTNIDTLYTYWNTYYNDVAPSNSLLTAVNTSLGNLNLAIQNISSVTPATTESYSYVNTVANATVAVEVKVPSGVVLDSITINGTTHTGTTTATYVAVAGETVTISYSYHYAYSTYPFTSSEDVTVFVTSAGVTNTQLIPIDYSPYLNSTTYREAVAAYERSSQKLVDAYETAYQVMEATSVLDSGTRMPIPTYTDLFLSQNILDALQTVISNTVDSGDNSQLLADLNTRIKSLEDKKAQLELDLSALSTAKQSLSTEVTSAIAALEELDTNITTVHALSTTANTDMSKVSSSYDAILNQLKSLLSSTSDLKNNSDSNLATVDRVEQTYTEFNREVTSVEQSSQTLSQSAADLQSAFEAELTESGNFADAFKSVFSNAFEDGVANEVLMDFLSNPVVGKAAESTVSTNVYRPFTWILILEIVSLFTAYVFGTQNVIRKVKNKYKVDKFENLDWINVLILTILSLVIGLVIGFVAAQQLGITRTVVPIWMLSVVIFTLFLVQGQYLLIKNIRVVGMGLSLVLLISYVYLTNAVGTVSSGSGIVSILKAGNILSQLETTLNRLLTDGGSAALTITIVFVLAVILLVLNTIFPLFKLALQRGEQDEDTNVPA